MPNLLSARNRRSDVFALYASDILVSFMLATFSAQAQSTHSSKQGGSLNQIPPQAPVTDNCIVFDTTPDVTATGCLTLGPDAIPSTHQIEIHFKSGRILIITADGTIKESHFWHNGRQIAVSFINAKNRRTHALYETETGQLIDKVEPEPADRSLLPDWAKDRAELEDEALPYSEALNAERTKWIAKVMHQIETIRPGMQRKDLDAYFTTEGGLSTRTEQRYVSRECPFIKVDVRFKEPDATHKNIWEDPEDIIESISRPYLEWSIMD